MTVLFVEHDMEVVTQYARRILVFHLGNVIADGAPAQVYFRNSTFSYPVLGGAYVVAKDVVVGRDPATYIEKNPSEGISSPNRRLLIKQIANPVFCEAVSSLFYVNLQAELRRITLPDAKESAVGGSFPHILRISPISITSDGSRFVYLEMKTVRKMVMVDNLQ